MHQNIYDNAGFFAGYMQMRRDGTGLNDVLEQPALRSLLPSLGGLRILDVGCGFGDFCRFAADHGAADVLGIDPSERMIGEAQRRPVAGVRYVRVPIEEFAAKAESFDLAVSSLALHYVADLGDAFERIASVLVFGGLLIFSVEHPIVTCAQGGNGGWLCSANGEKAAWKVDGYDREGPRTSRWFVDGVVRYHRTVATILNSLVDSGFSIERVLEPVALPQAEATRPELAEERRRPPFLVMRARLTFPRSNAEQAGAAHGASRGG